MDDEQDVMVSLDVVTGDPQVVMKVWEVIGRAAMGLALDGINVSTSIRSLEQLSEEENQP